MNLRIKQSLAFRLSLYTMICVVIVFVGVLFYNYQTAKKVIREGIAHNVSHIADLTVQNIDSILTPVKSVAEYMASFIASSSPNEAALLSMMQAVVQHNTAIDESTIAFEPYKFKRDKYYFAPTYTETKNGLKYRNLDSSTYDYFKHDWYADVKKLGHGIWTEPYFDTELKKFMITYSHPIYKEIKGSKEFHGVAECDVDLEWLTKAIASINDVDFCRDGYAFILSAKGNFIAHPNKEYYTKGKNFFTLNPNKKALGEDMIAGKTGCVKFFSRTLNKTAYNFYQPLKNTKWSLGVVISEEKLYSNLNKITFNLLIMGLIGYFLVLIMIGFVINFTITPLRTLSKVAFKIGKGNFNTPIPVSRHKDEIGVLSHAFLSMQDNLTKYIDHLKKTTADKEKIEKELSIAHEIQQSLLPHTFPELKEIELYATLIPAKEVGGDLYDYFFIDEKHLCFAVGDVSGKGVPAALFMAVTKTLLRAKMIFSTSPARVFNIMNHDLCKENESHNMFVTFFLGILDIETGLLAYCNAGHTPPLIHTANKGFYYFHTEDPHPPLGIMADTNYTGRELKLSPEDIFFLYTDGVTESMNVDFVQFSEEKLLEVLVKNKDESIVNIINNVKLAINQHAAGTLQSDDITMLILKMKATKGSNS